MSSPATQPVIAASPGHLTDEWVVLKAFDGCSLALEPLMPTKVPSGSVPRQHEQCLLRYRSSRTQTSCTCLKIGCKMDTFFSVTMSTGSGKNLSHKSAVALLMTSGGGVAVLLVASLLL